MTINITQTCDSCGDTRDLRFGYPGEPSSLKSAADQGGWREVRLGKHMCTKCINSMVGEKP